MTYLDYGIIENGVVVNVAVGQKDWNPTGMQVVPATEGCVIGATYADGVFTPPPQPDPPAPEPRTIYSTLDYFRKFTDAEYQAVRTGPIAIQRGLDMLIAAQYVDVTDPRVAQYLDGLVSVGIINDARKAELLEPPEAS
jgi:hypothetical protein